MTGGIDPREGLRLLREGAAAHAEDRLFLRVRGEDARDYLHRMTSQDLSRVEGGDVTRTLVLTPQGRMLGAPWVWALDGELVLDLESETVDDVLARLERYVITEDVTFAQEPGVVVLTLAGPRGLRRVRSDGEEARPHPGDLPRVGEASWDALRVLERVPAWGRELDGEILPLEARLEAEAISFSKGCYPGQEPITMAKHRGHPPSLLVRARITGGTEGGALLHDRRRVGRLATVTELTGEDEPNALAFVRYALAALAPTLEVEGGGEARILEGEGP